TGPLMLNGALNTSADPRCQVMAQPMGAEVCVVAGTNVNVGALHAVGTRPLVIIASGAITVTETLDASSSGGTPGAGANDAACLASGAAGNSNNGAGGGAGGSFGGPGADGGNGAGTNGGAATSATTATFVRGGCRGANGGKGTGTAGAGGAGGGAIYLIAGS